MLLLSLVSVLFTDESRHNSWIVDLLTFVVSLELERSVITLHVDLNNGREKKDLNVFCICLLSLWQDKSKLVVKRYHQT